jgi:hypothetical protein
MVSRISRIGKIIWDIRDTRLRRNIHVSRYSGRKGKLSRTELPDCCIIGTSV